MALRSRAAFSCILNEFWSHFATRFSCSTFKLLSRAWSSVVKIFTVASRPSELCVVSIRRLLYSLVCFVYILFDCDASLHATYTLYSKKGAPPPSLSLLVVGWQAGRRPFCVCLFFVLFVQWTTAAALVTLAVVGVVVLLLLLLSKLSVGYLKWKKLNEWSVSNCC